MGVDRFPFETSMSHTRVFVDRLMNHGEAVFHQEPAFVVAEQAELMEFLARAYARYRLGIAGTLLSFDEEAALGAIQFVTFACWALVSDRPADSIRKSLQFSLPPAGPESQLSADLSLRFLPTVYRRVRSRVPDDPVHHAVMEILRRWPLSGSLAEIEEQPTSDLSFGNHFGLQLLYAERLAACMRSKWVPTAGRSREAVEMVLQQQGKSLPVSASPQTLE